MKQKFIKIYNGKDYCAPFGTCPIVEYSPKEKIVKISDPEKPGNGFFMMSADEYNSLIKNAKTINK